MRYESFYPFSGNQSSPPRQQGFGGPPFSGQPNQFARANNPFNHPRQGPPPRGYMPGQEPSKIDGYMQTANRFLNTAQQFAPVVQQFAPVVQQFAPMMRNLPAMWKLYKGFQSMPSATNSTSPAPTAPSGTPSVARNAPIPTGPRPSTPRIFQPPDL